MRGIIDNIITFYEMRAEALDVLVANTQKAIEELAPDRERMDSEQREKLQNFVKVLTIDLNDMLTRFWFRKERKQINHEQMTDAEVKNLADFANFAETLAKDIRSLLIHFEGVRGQRFEEEFDKEVKQMETYVKKRLKKFEKTLTMREDNLMSRFIEYIRNLPTSIGKSLRCELSCNDLSINEANSGNEK
jgi:hypothetical protein